MEYLMSKDVQAWLKELTPGKKKDLEVAVKAKLATFSEVWVQLGNSSLTSGELALLRTFLVTELSGLLSSDHSE
jgi:hypothetical protein